MKKEITDDFDALLAVLPPAISSRLEEINQSDELLEVILDLGRVPDARFVTLEVILSEKEIARARKSQNCTCVMTGIKIVGLSRV